MHNMQWNWYTNISVNFQLPMEEQGGSDGEWMGDGGGQGEQMVEGFVGGGLLSGHKNSQLYKLPAKKGAKY